MLIQKLIAHGIHHGHDDHFGGHRGRRHRFMRGFEREFSRGFGPGFAGRARRGDVKFLVLEIVASGPRHGYEIIREIEELRGFRPSAGSIYPTLQLLEEGGFITGADVDGKRVFTVTDAGRELLATRTATTGDEGDHDHDHEHGAHRKLKASAMKLGAAVMGVRGSNDATLDRARAILDRARKDIYALLASDDEA